MKKNFFKKLSFVLALAMIVSVIAPAAGAFAAATPALSATKKYLHLSGQPGPDEYDFNIKNKVAGSKYAWSSDNEDVAVVDEANGYTTATGVGSAKISVVITYKDGKTKTLTATVVVRDNIETVKVSNPPDKALAVDQEYDFNRSFVTLAGSTKKTSAITRWTVDPADKATIVADSGLFKASEAGEYKVTAYSFQSKEKYENWLATKDASWVLDSDEITVKVAAGIVSTNQVNTTKFAVTFDSDMSKVDFATATVYRIINGKDVATGTEKIKEITFDATGKVATVEMYTNFAEGVDYKFVLGDLVGTFKAASTALSEVASIEFADFTHNPESPTGTPMLPKVVAKNKDGVIIRTGEDTEFAAYLKFTYDGELGKGYTYDNSVSIWIDGYAAPVTVTFTYYVYNSSTGQYDIITLKDTAIVTGRKADTNINAASLQFAINNKNERPADDSSDWKTSFSMAAIDTGYRIYSRFKTNELGANDAYLNGDGRFAYSSGDTDKLAISGDYVLPYKSGVVTILVKDTWNNDKVIGTFDITIQSTRGLASADFDGARFVSVSNNPDYGAKGDSVTTVIVKDTMGDAAPATAYPKSTSAPTGKVAPVVDCVSTEVGKIQITVEARSADPGVYGYMIVVQAYGQTRELPFTVTVVDGKSAEALVVAPGGWKLELSSVNLDLKEIKETKTVDIWINGYNKNGVVVDRLLPTEYDVTITKDGSDINANNDGKIHYNDEKFYVVTSGVTGAALQYVANAPASFNVTAKVVGTGVRTGRAVNTPIGSMGFILTDSTTKSFKFVPIVANGKVLDVVKAAFTLVLNGKEVSDDGIVGVTYMVADKTGPQYDLDYVATTGTSILVKEIIYNVTNTDKGTVTQYTFTVETPIATK